MRACAKVAQMEWMAEGRVGREANEGLFGGSPLCQTSVQHNVSKRLWSVAALRSVLWHEFGDAVPDEGEFNVGYFDGKQYTKKWLVTVQELEAPYSYIL